MWFAEFTHISTLPYIGLTQSPKWRSGIYHGYVGCCNRESTPPTRSGELAHLQLYICYKWLDEALASFILTILNQLPTPLFDSRPIKRPDGIFAQIQYRDTVALSFSIQNLFDPLKVGGNVVARLVIVIFNHSFVNFATR